MRTEPSGHDASALSRRPSSFIACTLPPPMSSPKPSTSVVEFAMARYPYRASSLVGRTRTGIEVRAAISRRSASRLAASRMALVATASTAAMPVAWQKASNTSIVRSARRIGSGLSSPSSPIPSLMRTASRISSACCHQRPGSYAYTTSRNEFEPRSATASRSTTP